MDFLGAALSTLTSILFFSLVVAGVFKAFQIAATLSEIKNLLIDIKRNTNNQSLAAPLPPSQMSVESAESLIRAVAELEHPAPGELERKS